LDHAKFDIEIQGIAWIKITLSLCLTIHSNRPGPPIECLSPGPFDPKPDASGRLAGVAAEGDPGMDRPSAPQGLTPGIWYANILGQMKERTRIAAMQWSNAKRFV
jgi:hypothetical protein